MKKTLITIAFFLALTPLAAYAQAQSQPDAAQNAAAQTVPTYSMTDAILTAGN